MNLKNEYKTHSSQELVKIATSEAGEYRPEAIEAAGAELASRGETWQKGKRGSRDKTDPPGPERDWRGRRDHLMMQYAVCWALLGFGALRLIVTPVLLMLDSLRPPPIEGETDPERDRSPEK